ncbi:MAG: Sec-independent protein translocase protein TatAt [Methanocella sp. PtaU1.Bin125]|nr:MAG: Sec-independent protein translocase protein TatAt [Methanocella sp. PtaU1.Bin125]
MAMIGTQEILLIFVVIVLLFGATKLPELARSMGRSMGEFKRGQFEVEKELNTMKGSATASNYEVALTRTQSMAKKMGIDIAGKSEDQLLAEIEKKLDKS